MHVFVRLAAACILLTVLMLAGLPATPDSLEGVLVLCGSGLAVYSAAALSSPYPIVLTLSGSAALIVLACVPLHGPVLVYVAGVAGAIGVLAVAGLPRST